MGLRIGETGGGGHSHARSCSRIGRGWSYRLCKQCFETDLKIETMGDSLR